MPRDKTASHVKIMAAAREEFMEYGFEQASMRRIGERCGMTAAGIYRHCRDKADLFDQLVAPAIERLNAWLEAHVRRYVDAAGDDGPVRWNDSVVDMMRDVVYPHMDDYRLLLNSARGSSHEHFLHDLTEASQAQMLRHLPMLKARGLAIRDVSPRELHLLLSAYTAALFEPVVHSYPLEEALRCLELIEAFFLPGWKALLGF
ncbi:MAG: TetR/AcrR family transcriptional regulator [Clostridia bacterium]|nr:TetR/AcrR family transcriptional regulator [Clostridia bacterium]